MVGESRKSTKTSWPQQRRAQQNGVHISWDVLFLNNVDTIIILEKKIFL